MKGEIPVGWQTGKHVHGEESIHILKGQGFSIINGQRFDWKDGSTLQIPYRAEHQHFNTGDEPALLLSATPSHYTYLGLGGIEQLDAAPEYEAEALAQDGAAREEARRG